MEFFSFLVEVFLKPLNAINLVCDGSDSQQSCVSSLIAVKR